MPLVIEDDDLEVFAVSVTDEFQVIGPDVAIEAQPIKASLDRTEGEAAEIIDYILAGAALEHVEVTTGAAREIVVALAAPQDVGRT